MMKRIIALLLALILTVGLLPTVALAADGTAKPIASVSNNDSSGNVHVKKEIYQNDNGTYKVRLESWATGTQTVTEKHLPMDIVLVLDVSGSMKEKDVVSSAGTPTQVSKSENNENLKDKAAANNLFVQVDGNYYPVTVQRNRQGLNNEYTYSYTKDGSTVNLGTYKGNKGTYGNSNMPLYSVQSNNYITRLDALKNAVNAFIEKVATDATKNKVDHKISIVKFAGTELTNKNGDDMYWVGQDHRNNTQIVKELTSANVTSNVTALQAAVNALNYGGATQADFGMNRAAAALGSFTSEDVKTRGRIVIMFTDGVPTDYQDYDNGVAGNAVAKARELKDKGAKVYTIAMIDSANPSDTSGAINRYMNGVSSNYPKATKCDNGYKWDHWYHYGVDLGTRGDGSYYQAASSSADSLKKIFDAISKDISNNTTALDGSAILFDELPENFEIPANAQNITTKTADYTGENTWGADTTVTDLTIKPKNNNTLFEITGFNYADNWCGKRTDNSYGGKKLIVEFNIQHDNYGGTQPTNKSAGISNEEEEDALVIVPNPSIAVPIATPSITGASATKVYNGTGIDVLENVAVEADKLVTGENKGKNAFVDIIVKVKDEAGKEYTYTIPAGETTGSWSPEHTEFKTPADVKIKSDGSDGKYSYDLSIIYQDKAQTNPAAPKTVTGKAAEYTITRRPVTLTSASAEKKYDGTPLTKDEVIASTSNGVGFVTGEGATYNVTGSQTNVGSSDNTFTYTLNEGTKATNYEITQKTGTLTVKPIDQEVVITIKGQIVTATYDGEEKTASGYTVTVPEGVDANKITVAVAEGKKVPSVSATDATTTALVQTITADMFTVTSPYKKVTINCENGSLTINPRKVKMVSGSASKAWDGTALTDGTVTDSGFEGYDGFVNGQGATYNVTGTITDPGSEDNRFTYTLNSNTKASNYDITTAYGKLTITGSKSYTITFKTETGGTINNQTNDITYSDLTAGTDFPNVPTTKENPGYYFDGWYKDGTKVTSFPEKVTENATYTAKWKKFESATLNLTNKFWKELTSDTATLPENANSFTLNIKNDNSQTVAQAHVLNVPLEQKSSKYTGTKAFAVESGSEMTFNAAGTYIYTVAEAAGSISGMSYDDTTYTMTVEVVANEGKLTIQSATIEGGTVDTVNLLAAEGTNSITFHNEYTKPKKSINLGDLIQKDFDKKTGSEDLPTGSSYTFRVRAYERFQKPDGSYRYSDAPYLGEVVMTEFGQKNFVFNNGVITFFEHGTHEYVVEEFNDSAENVEYDSNRYLLVLDVADDLTITARNAGSLNDEVSTQSVEQTPVITFCNKYNKEKDPDKLTINFADYVQKELTATGTKTASDVNFTVDVKEFKTVISSIQGEEEVNTYAGEQLLSTTLTAHFDSITGGETKTAPFNGSIVVEHAGTYSFELTEEDGQRTGVTYDDSTYKVYVYVKREGDKLVVGSFNIYKDGWSVAGETITFHNTIDTGKDDYYPIIIPTIINKDTGMLNKTDHFAYVIGYPDGTVHPNGQITRAEVATIFFRLLRDEVRDGAFTTSNSYSDVAYGKWYNNPISTMSALGIITGYPDGTFKPNKPITRAEFAAIAARFDETQSGKSATFSDVIGHWAAKEIGIAYYNDWIKGYPDGTFKPDQNITRAEAMTLINRVLERKPESPADLLTNMNKWTDNMDTSKWYYLDVQEATNSHGYTRKTFNYELWRQMLPDPDWSRYER